MYPNFRKIQILTKVTSHDNDTSSGKENHRSHGSEDFWEWTGTSPDVALWIGDLPGSALWQYQWKRIQKENECQTKDKKVLSRYFFEKK